MREEGERYKREKAAEAAAAASSSEEDEEAKEKRQKLKRRIAVFSERARTPPPELTPEKVRERK